MNIEKITPEDAADLLAVPLPFLMALVDCGALTPDSDGLFDRAAVLAHRAFRDALRAEIDEFEELRALVRFIASDYHELSAEKALWQRDDWKRRARALVQKYKPTAPAELIPVHANKVEFSKGEGLGVLVDVEEGRRRLHAIAIPRGAAAEPHMSAEEQARRRHAVEQANAHNRIEGIMPNPGADAIYERWIAGEIDSDEVTRQINALPISR
ncbi:antitoxin VbhA family protein [Rhodoblastus sp.]|jgi:hypothetical protein|uniref:antitoxin VbhA family protein n=1 Tax=Rhodoblastus sp. TaxID=1962975 RepID=UPI0025E219A2|nr:antitoxin VbhA family protein [Rhodoblastus sp.]